MRIWPKHISKALVVFVFFGCIILAYEVVYLGFLNQKGIAWDLLLSKQTLLK